MSHDHETQDLAFRRSFKCCVFVQTTRIEFDLPEYSVRRRYQDFDWLRIKLEDSQPTHLIPVSHMTAQPSLWRNTRLNLPDLILLLLLVLLCSRCQRSL